MSNANGVQIVGDRVYYRMELVATLNPMNTSKAADDFKKLLILTNNPQKDQIRE